MVALRQEGAHQIAPVETNTHGRAACLLIGNITGVEAFDTTAYIDKSLINICFRGNIPPLVKVSRGTALD